MNGFPDNTVVAQYCESSNLVQQCLFPYPFAVVKPFDKPQADKAQLDIPCNHRYPDFNLPSGTASTDKLLRMILGRCIKSAQTLNQRFMLFIERKTCLIIPSTK